MISRNLLVLAAVVACLLAAVGECKASGAHGRQLMRTKKVSHYQHCGTDQSGSYGCCKTGFICAYSNPWWSMCVTPAECPSQGGYSCNYDKCGKPTTPAPAKSVAQYQHCGDDVTGSYGCCTGGMICAFGNAWWSMCVTTSECPQQGGYLCDRDACGKTI